MPVIRALMVDDEAKNLRQFTTRLGNQFEKVDWEVRWETTTDPDAGQQLIRRAEPPFDFVLVDLLFLREDLPGIREARGLELITEAKERSLKTYILAVSSGEENLADLFDLAKHNGAHHAFRRYEFTNLSRDNSPAAIVKAVKSHLLDNGTVRTVHVVADQRDPAVLSIIDEVGEATLSQLYSRVLEAAGAETTTMNVRFLTPGASGAVVCSVTSEAPGEPVRRHVLKAGRDEQTLLREAQQGAIAAKVLPARLLVKQHPERPVGPVNGWYALGAPLPDRVMTLRAWLESGPLAAEVSDVLIKLFTEGLGAAHRENLQSNEPIGELLRFSHLRQSRVLQALTLLTPALLRPEGGRLADATDLTLELESFVREARPLGVPMSRLSQPTFTTYAHGDLHGGNVLICRGHHPTPVLIDTSEFGRAHWATDAARFAVDVLMRSVDAGVESLFFTRFEDWRELLRCMGACEPIEPATTDDEGTTSSLAALSWVMSCVPTLCPAAVEWEQHRWEWHLVLADYLLRSACHQDLPAPKRALGLVGAHDQLKSATRLLLASL
ncbi:hypothetical protein ACFQ6Q_15065 [Streptomyces sp. NPDC056437]|uniref:hypothetical protein n=1 Tax=Streptomyces sp. NPDC056437 TaxID=3345816 RepID=UPI003673873C